LLSQQTTFFHTNKFKIFTDTCIKSMFRGDMKSLRNHLSSPTFSRLVDFRGKYCTVTITRDKNCTCVFACGRMTHKIMLVQNGTSHRMASKCWVNAYIHLYIHTAWNNDIYILHFGERDTHFFHFSNQSSLFHVGWTLLKIFFFDDSCLREER